MMTAKEMFEKLGYKQDVDSDDFLQYHIETTTEMTWNRFMVVFNKSRKTYFVAHNYLVGVLGHIHKELLRDDELTKQLKETITQQMKELKWL